MTRIFPECDFCQHQPDPDITPATSLKDLEEALTDLLADARLTQSVLVLVPSPLQARGGYELFTIEPGPRADLINAAIGRRPPRPGNYE